jgi:hypothetical protein
MKIEDDGKGNYTIDCEHCGKPITKSTHFGMDCEDECERRAFRAEMLKQKKAAS